MAPDPGCVILARKPSKQNIKIQVASRRTIKPNQTNMQAALIISTLVLISAVPLSHCAQQGDGHDPISLLLTKSPPPSSHSKPHGSVQQLLNEATQKTSNHADGGDILNSFLVKLGEDIQTSKNHLQESSTLTRAQSDLVQDKGSTMRHDTLLAQVVEAIKSISDRVDKVNTCLVLDGPPKELNTLLDTEWLRISLVALTALQLVVQLYLLPAYLRDRDDMFLSSRSPILTAMHSISGIIMSVLSCVGYTAAMQSFSVVMMIYIWMQSFLVPLLAVPTALRAHRLLCTWRLNGAKTAASELMPLMADKSQVGFASIFQIESKMVQSRLDASESRHVQLACWGGVILLLYSLMWYCLTLGRCTVSIIQAYNAMAITALSITWLLISVFRVRHITDAFRIRNELYALLAIHTLFGGAQLAAFVIICTPTHMPELAVAVAYVSYAYIGVLWPLFCAYSQLMFPLGLRKRIERYRTKIAKNEMAFRNRFDDPVHREIFFKYLDLEFASELWLFWKDVEVFRTLAGPSTIREAARVMYNKYCRDGAMLDVKLDYDLQLESSWNMHSMSTGPQMYDVAQNAVYVKMLSAFPRYLHFVALNAAILPKPPKLASAAPGASESSFEADAVSETRLVQDEQSGLSASSEGDMAVLLGTPRPSPVGPNKNGK